MLDPIIVKNSEYIFLKTQQGGKKGALTVLEGEKDVPFSIKRVYYITKIEALTQVRGLHAHKKLDQVIFCMNGSFLLHLDDGIRKQDILMNSEAVGVRLGPELWHSMKDFSPDCIIMVVASDHYSEDDYIRDYGEFIKYLEFNH
ncbi:WxcM-like domain-containing protein [Leptospira fletcheri]|uniref:WxcM-like domain-containing protein n=1 Tax=Leptospira fletcheri TaxID=2484981 RepID=A0A4R9GDM2_9LEPT|nr:FdtA/QdtA family cupin domain-containing protein [Leptospira fletcheri]TGK09946.1 WxcM-like domain-containing protein [Leptospira fletcheri]